MAVRLLDAGEVHERLVVEPDEGRGVGEHHREHLGVEGADGEEPGQVRDRRPEEEEADEHPAAGEDEEHRQVQDERQGGADQHVALHRAVVLDGEEVGADEVRPAAERDEVVVDGAHALVVERRRAAVHVQLGAGPRGAARPPDEPRQERGPQPGGIGLDGREVRVAAREPGDGERLVGAPPDGLLAEERAEVLRREERRELEEPRGGGGLEERLLAVPGGLQAPRDPLALRGREGAQLDEDLPAERAPRLEAVEERGDRGVGVDERADRIVVEREGARDDEREGARHDEHQGGALHRRSARSGAGGSRTTRWKESRVRSFGVSSSMSVRSSRASNRRRMRVKSLRLRAAARDRDELAAGRTGG